MRLQFLVPLTLCASLTSFTASAKEVDTNPVYVDVGFVQMKADIGIGETSGNGLSLTVDEKDTAPILTVGYRVNDQFALEGGVVGGLDMGLNLTANYNDTLYGQTVVANGSLTVTGETKESYMLGGALIVPVNDSLSLRARAGVLWWDIDYYLSANVSLTINGTSYAANGRALLQSEDGNDPYVGLGVTYDVSKSVALKADYFRTKVDDMDVDALSLQVSYRF